jgi:hypothetical protein
MQLLDLVFRERSGYKDMQLRPYYADATKDLINELDNDTRGGEDLTPAALSRVAGRIIRPAAKHQGSAIIANGWGEKRFMFMMTVLVRKSRTDIRTLEISGYTDHVGAHQGIRGVKLDEDMALYFNSVTELNQSYMDTPTRRGWQTQIASSNHLIAPQVLPDFSRDRMSAGTLVMRPEDVFHNNPQNVVSTAFNRRASKENYLDMRHGFSGKGLRMSHRLNDSSTRYLHRSIKALATANEGEVFGQGNAFDRDTGSILKDARSQVREKTVSSIPVLADIARETNILEQGFITYGELIAMNQDYVWDDVKVFFERPETVKSIESRSGWSGRDNSTIAAIQIVRALPTFMAFHHISYVEFSANNFSAMGEAVIMIPECLPIIGKQVTDRSLMAFEERMITEVFHDMLPWPDCMFELEVRAGLSNDIEIKLKLEGEDFFEDVFPVFCDSLVAPVVVDDQDTIGAMSSSLTNIVEKLGSGRRGKDDPDYADTPLLGNSGNFNF